MSKILTVFFLLIICMSCNSMQVDSIDIVVLPWNILTRSAVSEQSIQTYSNAECVKIVDTSVFRAILDKIDSTKWQRCTLCANVPDIRMKMTITYSDSATKDVVSFSTDLRYTYKNGAQYNFVGALFDTIVELLPERYKTSIAMRRNCKPLK